MVSLWILLSLVRSSFFCTGITSSSWFLKRQTFSPLTRGQVANYCNMDEEAFRTGIKGQNRFLSSQTIFYSMTAVIWRVLAQKNLWNRHDYFPRLPEVRWPSIAKWMRRPSRGSLMAKNRFLSDWKCLSLMTVLIWWEIATIISRQKTIVTIFCLDDELSWVWVWVDLDLFTTHFSDTWKLKECE